MVLNVHKTIRLIRDGEKGGGEGVWRWGEREITYLSLHCHHQDDSCIKMGSDESHFNVSVGSDGQSHKTVSTNHNLSEEKGEPKRYRTEALLVYPGYTLILPYPSFPLHLPSFALPPPPPHLIFHGITYMS